MKNRILGRIIVALSPVLLVLAPVGAESSPSMPGDGTAREVRRRPQLDYHEYVRLVTGRKMPAKRAAKARAKPARPPGAAVKEAVSSPPAPAPPVAIVAPADPVPRRPGTAWRPGSEEVREILRTSRDLRGAVLQRMDLAGVDLRGADLTGADLFGANLDRATLDGADLRGASLEMASLRGTSLRGAKMAGAGLFKANLEGADLSGADLTGVYAVSANLRGASLASTVIRGGAFTNVALDGGKAGGGPVRAAFSSRLTAEGRVVAVGEENDVRRPVFREKGALVAF